MTSQNVCRLGRVIPRTLALLGCEWLEPSGIWRAATEPESPPSRTNHRVKCYALAQRITPANSKLRPRGLPSSSAPEPSRVTTNVLAGLQLAIARLGGNNTAEQSKLNELENALASHRATVEKLKTQRARPALGGLLSIEFCSAMS